MREDVEVIEKMLKQCESELFNVAEEISALQVRLCILTAQFVETKRLFELLKEYFRLLYEQGDEK